MKRREAREIAFRLTYEMIMTGEYNSETRDELLVGADNDSRNFVLGIINGIAENKTKLNEVISEYAHGYELDRLYKTDLAALYVATYEILYTTVPTAVAINEAVEIVKAYSDSQSFSFVNGILASVVKKYGARE